MKDEDVIEKLKKAAKEGNVHFCVPDKEKDILVDDGTGTTIGLVREMHLEGGAFGLCLADGGGFATCVVTPDQWETMKQKVDAFLQIKAEKN